MNNILTVRRLITHFVVAIAVIEPSLAEVVRVETALSGNKLDLVELEVTSGGDPVYPNRVVPYADLIPATVIDYLSVVESNAANTLTVLATPDPSPPVGDDRLFLLGDQHLNTGVFNPAYGSPGIHVEFQTPVMNGPGVDFVAFELTIGSGQTPDPIEILQPNGVGSTLNVASAAYQLREAIPAAVAPNTYEVTVNSGDTATFANLRDSQLTVVGTVMNPKWHAISIDLDSLGVPEWGSASELYILSDNLSRNTPVDLLMVAGLPPVFRPGDFDGDLDVDGRDFLIWQQEFGNGLGSPADGTNDGIVDAGDLALWQTHYLPAGLAVSTAFVPEPNSLVILVASAMVNQGSTRRRFFHSQTYR